MSYEHKNIGHVVVRIPVSRRLEGESHDPEVWLNFESFELLSEKIDVEYLHSFLNLLQNGETAQYMLDAADTAELLKDLAESIQQKVRELRTV